MKTLLKDLSSGSVVYALIKGEELKYTTGNIVNVGQQRIDMHQSGQGGMQMPLPAQGFKQVTDITFAIDGKNFTEAVELTADAVVTSQLGELTMVASDKEAIVRELQATEKRADDYLKQAETEIPKQEKRREQCKDLIAELDTNYKERQELENRFKSIEQKQEEFGSKLDKILKAVEKK